VVVDYKTDSVSSDDVLRSRVAAYALQGRVYTRAIRDALSLAHEPRMELWFIAADRVVVVEP